jgi:hypothetical protein
MALGCYWPIPELGLLSTVSLLWRSDVSPKTRESGIQVLKVNDPIVYLIH